MCRSREINGQDDKLWNSCQNSLFDIIYTQKHLIFSDELKKLTPMVGILTFHILGEVPLKILETQPGSKLEIFLSLSFFYNISFEAVCFAVCNCKHSKHWFNWG